MVIHDALLVAAHMRTTVTRLSMLSNCASMLERVRKDHVFYVRKIDRAHLKTLDPSIAKEDMIYLS